MPNLVKFFVGSLYVDENILKIAISELEDYFGKVDLFSEEFDFRVTDYYNREMGYGIKRKFFSFEKLFNPVDISTAKIFTNEVEKHYLANGKRKVNLDVGYMDYDKVVLASAKYCINKVYVGNGIYADLTLHYEKGNFTPYPWAFMDFKSLDYNKFFLKMREIYKRQMKEYKRLFSG
ncbi:MAG: DUF4416 family protein [Candidatus Marinimicrobia bacterium]|nr:DUF4416 family protein [Candidatus Neomarinimicrobiota bacterium]